MGSRATTEAWGHVGAITNIVETVCKDVTLDTEGDICTLGIGRKE